MSNNLSESIKKRNRIIHLCKNDINIDNYRDIIITILNILNIDEKDFNESILTNPQYLTIQNDVNTKCNKNLSDIMIFYITISNMTKDELKNTLENEDIYNMFGITPRQLDQYVNQLHNLTSNKD